MVIFDKFDCIFYIYNLYITGPWFKKKNCSSGPGSAWTRATGPSFNTHVHGSTDFAAIAGIGLIFLGYSSVVLEIGSTYWEKGS